MHALLRVPQGKSNSHLKGSQYLLIAASFGSFNLSGRPPHITVINSGLILLQIFTKVFFEKNSGSTNRNDNILYQIFAYLSFFRLDELSPPDYRKLVMSQEAQKMHVFMQFAFNAETLRENLREPWMALYDFSYIDEKIIGGVERNLPAVAEIIKSVEKRATGKVTSALSVSSH